MSIQVTATPDGGRLLLDQTGRGRVTLLPTALQDHARHVYPDLSADVAAANLARLLKHAATVEDQPPTWLLNRGRDATRPDAVAWLLLGEDVAFPLRHFDAALAASICIVRGTMSSEQRDARKDFRVARRDRTRARSKSGPGRGPIRHKK